MSKIIYLLLVLFLFGCRSADISSYISKSDTTIQTKSKVDTIMYSDSIYVYDRDTIMYVYRQRYNYHVKHHHDTIYKVFRDTIYAKNIHERKLSSLIDFDERYDYSLFWIIVVLLVILLFIYKKIR